jgi:hypothetical protein
MPLPARVILPAPVSLLSGTWAVTEWRDRRRFYVLGVDLDAPSVDVEDTKWREREAWRRDLADRQLRLKEAREARLAARERNRPGTQWGRCGVNRTTPLTGSPVCPTESCADQDV